MARKISGKKSKRKNKIIPLDKRLKKAKGYLDESHYGKALSELKELWKTEKTEEVASLLCNAYVNRSKQLASKGLYKEAYTLLENSYRVGDKISHVEWYISWLYQTSPPDKVMKAYYQYQSDIEKSPFHQTITEIIAILLLYGKVSADMLPPKESNLHQHLPIMQHALACYSKGQNEEALLSLKQLPYRSTYRNLGLILKALTLMTQANDNQKEIKRLLHRIPKHSPFYQMAQMVQIMIEPSASIATLSQANLALLLEARGWDNHSKAAVTKLSGLASHDAKGLFDCLLKHHEAPILATNVKKYCYNLLPEVKGEISPFEKTFGLIPQEEKTRIKAIIADKSGNSEMAVEPWDDYLAHLKKQPQTPLLGLKKALVLRHIADYLKKAVDPGCDCYECMDIRKDYGDCLEESLKFDPLDKKTYLNLLSLYDKTLRKNSKQYRQLVDKLLNTFPRDAEVLQIAVNTAYKQKSFSKAMKISKQWLTLDPLNQVANTLLLEIQLAYIKSKLKKKTIGTKSKVNAIFNDIVSSNQNRNKANAQLVEINQALLALIQGNDQIKAIRSIESALSSVESKPAFYCQLMLEAAQYDLNPDTLECLPKRLPNMATQQDVEILFTLWEKYQQRFDWQEIKSKKIQTLLVAPKNIDLSKTTWFWIIKLLIKGKLYALADEYANQAKKQLSQTPLLVYYSVIAKTKNNPAKAGVSDMDKLEKAMADAKKKKDIQALQLIGQLMDDIMSAKGSIGRMLFDFI